MVNRRSSYKFREPGVPLYLERLCAIRRRLSTHGDEHADGVNNIAAYRNSLVRGLTPAVKKQATKDEVGTLK